MSDYFPTDVTIEILQRLPVKSLIRFTSVCKSWRSIITGSSFISSHLSIAKNRPTHLLRRYDIDNKMECYSLLEATEKGIVASSKIHFPLKSIFGYYRIVGSWNGLLCLLDDIVQTVPRIIFWNPTVRKSLTLPEPGINLKEPHLVVLGFGGTGDDTKIVRLVYCKKLDGNGFKVHPQAEIYSLKKKSWRRLEGVAINLQILEFLWHQALLNGVVHWLAYEAIKFNPTFRSSILTFNVANEDFDEVFLPVELSREYVNHMNLSLIMGALGVIRYSKEMGQESADVWIMKEYGLKETWTKLYKISMLDGIRRVVALWSKTEALVALDGNELGCYESESEQVKKLGISGTSRPFYVDGFVESLVLFRECAVEDAWSGVRLSDRV